jgi:hypothetical protein
VNTKLIDAIANAVLYEGYMLYPYRASSVKNRQRFNFGVLYPKTYSEAQSGSDAWSLQTECLVEGSSLSAIEVKVRFLKLISRSIHKLKDPVEADEAAEFEAVSALDVDGKIFSPWQEAIECDVTIPACNLHELALSSYEHDFAFPAGEETELLRNASNQIVGSIARKQESISGIVEIAAELVADGVFKIQISVKNLAAVEDEGGPIDRDRALVRSLASAHVVLGVVDGQFVSSLDPPEHLKDFASTCHNAGVWPVLVGAEGERDTLLASPIILYDYPQIAPESPGDLFDGTEIDEILALRIMTMTDDEKREMRDGDDRARRILERTETLPMDHLAKLHGTLRELRSLKQESS